MFTISQIRTQARQTINSTPGMFPMTAIPVGLNFIMTIIQYATQRSANLTTLQEDWSSSIGIGNLIFPLLFSLLVSFISLSLLWTVFQIVRGMKDHGEIKDALAVFNSPHLGKIFCTFFVKNLYLFLLGLIAYVGGIIFIAASLVLLVTGLVTNFSFENVQGEFVSVLTVLIVVGLILTILGIALYIPQQLAYSQVEYILFEQLENNQYAGANAIIKTSRQMMKGYKGKRFVLDLSFIGWFILTWITFGLAGIYVWPYYYAAQAHFFQAIKEDTQMRQTAYHSANQTTTAPEQAVEKTIEQHLDSPIERNDD